MALYVYCDHSLYSYFDVTQFRVANDRLESKMLPWIAKVYVEGEYRCSGILIDLSWVLVSESCLWDVL